MPYECMYMHMWNVHVYSVYVIVPYKVHIYGTYICYDMHIYNIFRRI